MKDVEYEISEKSIRKQEFHMSTIIVNQNFV
jgi:hypothetical protein